MDELVIGMSGRQFEKKSTSSAAKNAGDHQSQVDEQSLEQDRARTRIQLLQPALGEVTVPLQQHVWPAPPLEPPPDATLWHWQRFLAEHDRSMPRPVEFSWTPPEETDRNAAALRYDLEIAAAHNLHEKILLHQLSAPSAEVYNLRVGTEYLWKVTARQGRIIVNESSVGHFKTDPTLPRWIRVPGATNVRDLGGWPLPNGRRVRQGLFYRGSEMNSHCTINDIGKRVLIEELGIRSDIDLRGQGEDRQPVLDPDRVQYMNFPVLAYDSIASPQFTGRIRALFGRLANRQAYPLYLHCWGGADRTGTIAFLVGALLGMYPDDLATDYELTSLSIWGERLSSSDAYLDLLQTLALFAPVGASYLTQVERYLRVIGVTVDEVAAIRDILTE